MSTAQLPVLSLMVYMSFRLRFAVYFQDVNLCILVGIKPIAFILAIFPISTCPVMDGRVYRYAT